MMECKDYLASPIDFDQDENTFFGTVPQNGLRAAVEGVSQSRWIS